MTQTQNYTHLETKKLDGSECEIRATIPTEVFTIYRAKALKELGADVEVPGFRKGHVPEDMLIGHVGESRVLDKAANLALSVIYPEIVLAEKLNVIGSPNIQITKIAKDNPLEFTATSAIMPEVTLPDYTAIAKKHFGVKEEKIEVTDEEVTEALTHIRRQRAQIDSYEKQKEEGAEQPQVPQDIKDEDLPELTDDFVQTLGDFKTVADFEAKVRENISEEKKLRANEKKRIETIEKIIADAKIELPKLLIDQEVNRIQAQMEGEVAQTGTQMEDYLKNIGKTLEELRTDWKPEAEKRGKLQLILNKIADEQKVSFDADEVQREVTHILEHYPQAQEEHVRFYVESTKRNEAVFKWLESQAS